MRSSLDRKKAPNKRGTSAMLRRLASRSAAHAASRAAMLALAGLVTLGGGAQAATYVKADNTSNLTTAASYVANSGSPTSAADFVQFDSNYVSAAIANTGALTLGGFIITTGTGIINFGSSSTNTWNVGDGANTGVQTLIDMSAATRDVNINNGNGFFRLTGGSGSTMIFNVAAGRTLTMNQKVNAQGNNKTLRLDGSGNIVFNAALSAGTGPFAFNVNGANVTLNAANTFSLGTGAFTITSGQLNLGNAGALGGVGAVNLTGGTLAVGFTNNLQTVNLAAASGSNVTFASGIGTVNMGGLSGAGSFALTDAGSSAVALSVGANNVAAATYSGVLSGAGSLTKVGTGTLTLSGLNTYTGGTTISGGQVTLSNGGNTSANLGTGAINLSNGAILRLNSTSATTEDDALTVAAGAAGTVSFRGNTTFAPSAINGTGTLTLQEDNGVVVTPNSFVGTTGTIAVRNGGTGATLRLGATYVNNSLLGGVLDLGAGVTETRNAGTNATVTTDIGTLTGVAGSSLGGSAAGTGTFVYSIGARNETSTFAGTIVDGGTKTAITKVGTGTLTLTGANTYTGGTTVNAGTLALGAAAADGTGALTVNNGGTVSVTVTNALGGGATTLSNGSTVQNAFIASGGTANDVQTSSNLTIVNGVATLDFGLNNQGAMFTFTNANADTFGGILNIINYTGNPFDPSTMAAAAGGGLDQLFFAPGVEHQLTQVYFIDPSGNTGTYQGRLLSSGEVVAPEPSQWAALLIGALGLGGLSLKARRRSAAQVGA